MYTENDYLVLFLLVNFGVGEEGGVIGGRCIFLCESRHKLSNNFIVNRKNALALLTGDRERFFLCVSVSLLSLII